MQAFELKWRPLRSHVRSKSIADSKEFTKSSFRRFNSNYHWSLMRASNKLQPKTRSFVESTNSIRKRYSPYNQQSLYTECESLIQNNQTQMALPKLLNLMETEPTAKICFLLAVAYTKLNNNQKALEMINKCIQINPKYEEGLWLRAKFHMKNGNFMKAQYDYLKATKLVPVTPVSFMRLGDCYLVQRKYQSALNSYEQAIYNIIDQQQSQQQQVFRKQCQFKCSICQFQLSDFTKAENTLTELVQSPIFKTSESYYYLGLAQLKSSNRQKGLLSLQTSLRINTNCQFSSRSLRKSLILCISNQQFYEALRILQIARTLNVQQSLWQIAIQGCMQVIRHQYFDGLVKLEQAIDIINQKHTLRQSLTRDRRTRLFKRQIQQVTTQSSNTTYMDTQLGIQEREVLYPILLSFKAYALFFCGEYMKCIQTYQQYDRFNSDIFGKQSDITYNKCLCQALIMTESGMLNQGNQKYLQCIDIHQLTYGRTPVSPVLYKTAHNLTLSYLDTNEREFILMQALQWLQKYQEVLENEWLNFYFKGAIYTILQDYSQASQFLDRSLKLVDECSWKLLFWKGVVEVRQGNYYTAVKQFSAGLIIDATCAKLYLSRAISFLLQGYQNQPNSQKGQNYINNCFQDLQKYITYEQNQQEISLWVSKLLFYNQAYKQSIRSLNKITHITQQVQHMLHCVNISQGIFQSGGRAGQIIHKAFQGTLITQQQENHIFQQHFRFKNCGFLEQIDQKWLILMHLYITKKHHILIKYLQTLIFYGTQKNISLFRFNLAIAYLLVDQQQKAINLFKGLQNQFSNLQRLVSFEIDPDECLACPFEGGLSQYLPNRAANFVQGSSKFNIFVKPYIPMPTFPKPDINIPITDQDFLEVVNIQQVQKKLQAPWIHRMNNWTVKFTDQIADSQIGSLSDPNTVILKI